MSFAPTHIRDIQIVEEIGSGAHATVYLGRRGPDRHVAVKILRERGSLEETLDAAIRFRREGNTLARLDHPGLVKVLEVGEADGRPYLVMEHAEGRDLASEIALGGPMREDQLFALATQLARALVVVHRQGLVHRDIKPGNIIVDSEGSAKLVDFGLVEIGLEGAEREADDRIVGTLMYAAPEQTRTARQGVDGRTDLYALGGTLFYCATGRPPFEGRDAGELLQQHAAVLPPRLGELTDRVGPLLSAIVDKLLAKDPAERYQSAAGLLADLEDRDLLDAAAREGALQLGLRDFRRASVEVPLVGRSAELATLAHCRTAVSERKGELVLVEGPSGSGKTRLARELVDSVRSPRTLVLSAKCNAGETTPFGPLRDALDRHIARILRSSGPGEERQRLRTAAGEWSGLLKRLSPGMQRLLADVPDLRAHDPQNEAARFYEALADFVSALAGEDRELVLFIDDVQWMDDTSPEVLCRLGARIKQLPLLVVMTARNQGRDGAVVASLAERLGENLGTRVALGALSEAESIELVRHHLGGRPVAADVMSRIVALGQGNPFAVGQYVQTLLESGAIQLVAGEWRADPERINGLALSDDVVKLVVDRIETLEPETVRLARVGAIIGAEFRPSLAAEVAGSGAAACWTAIDRLVRANLVERTQGERVRFVHDRVREAMIDGIGSGEARDLHQAIAEALDAQPDDDAQHVFSLARHYASGHVDRSRRRVLETSTAAGLRSLESYANRDAYDWLQSALSAAGALGIGESQLASLREALAVAATRIGRLSEAYAQLDLAVQEVKQPVDRARLHFYTALALASEGKNVMCWDRVRQGLEELGTPYPATPEAEGAALADRMQRWASLDATGEGHGEATGEEADRRRLLSELNFLGSFMGFFLGRPNQFALLILEDRINTHALGTCREASRSHVWYGILMGLMVHRAEAERHAQLSLTMAEQLGDPAAIAYARMYGAFAYEMSGDSVRAERMARAAEPFVERFLGAWERAQWVIETAYQYVLRGYAREAVHFALERIERVRETGSVLFQANIRALLYSQLMLMGRKVEALELRREWLALCEKLPGVAFALCYVDVHHMDVLLDQGELGEEIEQHIRGFLSWNSEEYWNRHAHLLIGYVRLEQCERAAASDRERTMAALDDAIAQAELRSLIPLHQCHLEVLFAGRARLEGRLDEALEHLGRAETLSDAADSPWGRFSAVRERARVARAQGDDERMRTHALTALQIARERGYRARIPSIESEFGVRWAPEEATPNASVSAYTHSRSLSDARASRRANALLEVSLASASSLEPREQARAALDAIVRELGAERGFLLILKDGALEVRAGRSAEGDDIDEMTAYSTTVVREVLSSERGMVVTGTDDSQLLGSESAVVHNLRSIMAAPLRLRGRMLGVVYVDSRLLRGLFAEEDLDFLQAIGSHLAIALQTAQMAKREAERVAMEKDLALTASMQGLFLPPAATIRAEGYRISASYRPMTQCSGDWWWYDEQRPRPLLVVGDVTGHGAGAAMLTVFAMTFIRFPGRRDVSAPFEEVLAELDRSLRELAGGQMAISLLAIEFDRERSVLRLHSASALPVFVLGAEGVQVVTFPPSSPVGRGDGHSVVVERPVSAGDRLLAFTDGLPEMPVGGGRQLGLKEVRRLFAKTAGMEIDEARSHIVAGADGCRGEQPQEDDFSFFLIDIL